jgi:hypothetical protein
MRKVVTAAIAAGVSAAMLAPQALAAHHGGGGGHTTVVVVPGSSGPYAPVGTPAAMDLELTDAPMAAAEGDVRRGEVIGRQQIRAEDAVVLDAAIKGEHRDVPAGTVLARVSYAGGSLWCDTRGGYRLLFADQYDCFEGSDGTLKRHWSGHTMIRFLGFGPSGVQRIGALPAPVPYHRATPEQRPTAAIGWRLCADDGVRGPPRFALVVSGLGQADGWPEIGGCVFGVWPDRNDPSVVDLGGLRLQASALPAGGYHYRLLGRIKAGPIQALVADSPPLAIEGQRVWRRAAMRPYEGDAMVVTGPAKVALGSFTTGQTFLTAPVRHGITGVLQNRISPGLMWKSDTPVEVGQPVFGMPSAEGMVWCAPRRSAETGWDTACFLPYAPGFYWWIPHRMPALMPYDSLYSLSQTGPVSSGPSVLRGPVDLPPMTVSLMLGDVKLPDKPGRLPEYDVDVMVDWGQGAQRARRMRMDLGPAGRQLNIFGVRLRLKPGPDPVALVVSSGE